MKPSLQSAARLFAVSLVQVRGDQIAEVELQRLRTRAEVVRLLGKGHAIRAVIAEKP